MTRYNICIPTEYTQNGEKKTCFTKVGAAFVNKQNNGEEFLKLVLDFPVGVTEFVAFLPKNSTEEDEVTD